MIQRTLVANTEISWAKTMDGFVAEAGGKVVTAAEAVKVMQWYAQAIRPLVARFRDMENLWKIK